MKNVVYKSADCDNCFLRRGGYCSQLRNDPCSDFKPLQVLSKEEKERWPGISDYRYPGMVSSFGYSFGYKIN